MNGLKPFVVRVRTDCGPTGEGTFLCLAVNVEDAIHKTLATFPGKQIIECCEDTLAAEQWFIHSPKWGYFKTLEKWGWGYMPSTATCFSALEKEQYASQMAWLQQPSSVPDARWVSRLEAEYGHLAPKPATEVDDVR